MTVINASADGETARPVAAPARGYDPTTERRAAQWNAVAAFLIRCGSAALLFASQIALARWMGANEYGVYVSVWSAIIIVGGVATLGLNLGVMRLVQIHREGNDADGLRGLVVGTRVLGVLIGLLLACIGSQLLALIPMSESHRAAAVVALVCLPFYALSDMQDGLGRGHGWIVAALFPPYVIRPLLLLALMLAAWALDAPMVATTAAACAVIAVSLAAVVQAAWLNCKFALSHGAGPRRYALKAWIRSSLPLLAIAGAELAIQNADIMVMSRFAAPAEVAVYFAAAKTMALMMFVHYAVGSAMASRFAGLKERGDAAGLQLAVRDAVAWTFWPSIAVALVILLSGPAVLALFGPGFADGYPVMAILVAGFLIRSAMGPAEILLNMMGEQRICAAIMLSGACVSVAFNLALVPWWGAKGAAAATALALSTVGVLNGVIAERRLGLKVAIWRH